MATSTKMKIKKGANGTSEVLVLVKHPMETGDRKDKKTGKKIPAHYIQTMTFKHNGNVVAETSLGTAVSANPLLGIALADAKSGDKVTVDWVDNQGETGSAEATVK